MTCSLSKEDGLYIQASLLHMGVVKRNKSSQRLLSTLQCVVKQDAILDQPAKCLYVDLAKMQKCSIDALLHSLRSEIRTIWKSNPENCMEVFFRSPSPVPCPSIPMFLRMYVSAFQKGVIQKWVDSLESGIRL